MENNLEKYFSKFRKNIIGIDAEFETPYGKQKMIYADWIASGRLYEPIERVMSEKFGPLIGNTHSEASETGVIMTRAYKFAQQIIKQHVNASEQDCIISSGSGMTRVVNKLQRILGLKLPDENSFYNRVTGMNLNHNDIDDYNKPIVFITHVEHHSNHFSWLETICDVEIIPFTEDLKVDINAFKELLKKYDYKKLKIGAFSAGSNVTGYFPPVDELAQLMHQNNGLCFVDFAASGPYVEIDMHKDDEKGIYYDAIYFSPHKFLGGPGSAAVLVFNKSLYGNINPDNPGGGTVIWTSPWNEIVYSESIEIREDGGTPAFLQTIRAALSIRLKEQMGVENIEKREEQLISKAFEELSKIEGIHILAKNETHRLGVVSFYSDKMNQNLITKILNDRFGVQVRGGCSCAGPYGHYLLKLNRDISNSIKRKILEGDSTSKPGWVRISLHPTMTDKELEYVIDAIKQIHDNAEEWSKDYYQDKDSGEFFHKDIPFDHTRVEKMFEI